MACCLTKPFSEQMLTQQWCSVALASEKLQEVLHKWTCKMSLKQSLIKLLPHLLGPMNQLTLMRLIAVSGVWYIFIPGHFDSSTPVTKLINRVSDQHQPVTSCWALWRGMIYHVMAVSDLVRTHGWCSINTWGRDKMAANSQTTFQYRFLLWILIHLVQNFNEICSQVPN